MRKLFIGLSISSLLALASCQSEKNNNTQQQANETPAASQQEAQTIAKPQQTVPLAKEPATTIPPFKFYKVKSGMAFSNEDIPANRNNVFLLFDPSCGHCQHETTLLAKNYDKLKDVNLYFVSMNDPALMATFLETFGKELVGKPNVEVLYDRNQLFIQLFHVPKQFPANYVYGADGKLKSSWEGEKDINSVIAEFTK